MRIHGMDLVPFTLPCAVILYPRGRPDVAVSQVPRVFALEWLPGGLLLQFRGLRLQTGEVQTHYRIASWEELQDCIILVEEEKENR